MSATRDRSPAALALWESFGIFLALYVIEICAGFIAIIFLGWDHEGFGDPSLAAKIILIGQFGTIAAAYYVQAKLGWYGAAWFSQKPMSAQQFWRVGQTIILLMAFTIFWSQLRTMVAGAPDTSNDFLDAGLLTSSSLTQFIFVLAVVLVGPIAEEIAFRGLMLDRLQRQFSAQTSNLVQAFLFASAHLNAETFIPLFAVGYVAGELRQRSGCLMEPITLHIINNAIYVLALMASH